MGFIQRQAAKRSILAYIGAFIGIISQLWIFSKAFDVYGEVQFILSMITFFLPFASLGIIGISNRFYPFFKNSKEKDFGYLGILLIGGIASFGLFLLLSYFLRDDYYAFLLKLDFDMQAFKSYNKIIFGSLFFAVIAGIIASHSANLRRIVVPYALFILSWKLFTPILIGLFLLGFVTKILVLKSIFWLYLLIALGLVLYVIFLGEFNFKARMSNVLKQQYKPMISFALFGVLASVGSIMALRIDKIMVRGLTDDFNTGIYSSFVVLAGLVLFPCDALTSITSPQVASAWKNNDIIQLKELNRRVSEILLFTGIFIFLLIWLGLDDILKLTSNYNDFALGLQVFLFLGLAKTFDSAFGINGIILLYSKFYYLSFVAMMVLAGSNIYLNMHLIPEYGMTGAAIASCVSIIGYNIFYYLFNWFKFGIQGFKPKDLMVVLILVGAYFLVYSWQPEISPVLRIVLRSSLYILLSLPIIYYSKLAPEVSAFIDQGATKVSNLLRS